MTRVAVVVQARTSSRRMPGKVLAPLAGAPALVRVLERAGAVTRSEWLVVATSDRDDDDAIEGLCRSRSVSCVRGSLNDVLDRFVQAVPPDCDAVVRVTGDCPLLDPALVDEHVERYVENRDRVDYVSNAVVRTFPDGLDVEVMSTRILREAHRTATRDHDREHVTPWIQRRARQLPVTRDVDLSALRWTLDTPHDHEVLAAIHERLAERKAGFGREEVYRLLIDEPELIHLDRPPDPAERARWRARIREVLQ